MKTIIKPSSDRRAYSQRQYFLHDDTLAGGGFERLILDHEIFFMGYMKIHLLDDERI